jgi:hypothetical protein
MLLRLRGEIMFRSEVIESLIYIAVLTVGIVWYGVVVGKKEKCSRG